MAGGIKSQDLSFIGFVSGVEDSSCLEKGLLLNNMGYLSENAFGIIISSLALTSLHEPSKLDYIPLISCNPLLGCVMRHACATYF
jgi:hypothetical protein